MKIYIVECDGKASTLGYKTPQEAIAFLNERTKNALANGFDVVDYNCSEWRSYLMRESDGATHDYKILEIQVNE